MFSSSLFREKPHVLFTIISILSCRLIWSPQHKLERHIKMVTGCVVHWFRKGLRLHDNPALLAALDRAAKDGLLVRPVYILDPWFVKNARVGVNRFRT